jgi:hypothetical protein
VDLRERLDERGQGFLHSRRHQNVRSAFSRRHACDEPLTRERD